MRFDYDTSYADAQRLLRHWPGRIAYAALAALLLAGPLVLPKFFIGEAAATFIACIMALGLMVLTGFTGQVSLGHAAFVAIGAYAEIGLLDAGLPFPLALPVAGAIAGLAGLLIGLPAIRVSGLYLAMVTLAFALVVEQAVGRWKSVTGGYDGAQVPDARLFGANIGGLVPFYYVCLAVLVLALLALINLTRGYVGRAFVGIRDSEAAAHALGIWVSGYKVLAFGISAAITGLGGALLAHQVQYVTPDVFSLNLSMQLVLMVVVGGLGSLRGAVLGAVLIGLLPTAISRLKALLPAVAAAQFGLETFIFGLVLAGFVLFEPSGLNGRWIKLRSFFEAFPLYRRRTFVRGKAYASSERHR